jgi:hypothetical protein
MIAVVYSVSHWYNIQFIIGAICCVPLLTWFFTPKSVRWLAQNGRKEEAKELLKQIAKYNRKKIDVAKMREINQARRFSFLFLIV